MLPAWLAARTQVPTFRYFTVVPLSEQASPVVEASTAERDQEARGRARFEGRRSRRRPGRRGVKGDGLRGLADDDRSAELGGREVVPVAGLVDVQHAVADVRGT